MKRMKFRTKIHIYYGCCVLALVPIVLSLLCVKLRIGFFWRYGVLAAVFMFLGVALSIGCLVYGRFVARCPHCGCRLHHLLHSDFCRECGAYLYQDEEQM